MGMEHSDRVMTGEEIKERLRARGLHQRDLAAASGIPASVLSSLLNGRMYCGPMRREKIERALLRLSIDQDAAHVPPPLQPGEFRIRRL